MTDDKTPMERFDDLLSRIFQSGKQPPKESRPEEDAQEIMEGGVAPTEGEEPVD